MHACHVHFAHLLLDFLKLSAIGSKKRKRKKKIGLIIHVVNILLWKAFYRLTFDAFPVDICPFLQQVLRYLLVPLVA